MYVCWAGPRTQQLFCRWKGVSWLMDQPTCCAFPLRYDVTVALCSVRTQLQWRPRSGLTPDSLTFPQILLLHAGQQQSIPANYFVFLEFMVDNTDKIEE